VWFSRPLDGLRFACATNPAVNCGASFIRPKRTPTKELFLLGIGQTVGLPDLYSHEAATSGERKRVAVLARAFIASVSRSRGGALVTKE
jgi:hypothetical protein